MPTSIDWSSDEALRARHELRFMMVPPNDLGGSLGELEGVDLSKSSITEGYYTDIRQAGRITVVDGNWVRQSMVRVIHEVPELDFSEELATFLVVGDDSSYENGVLTVELECKSRLYGLSTRKAATPLTVAKGGKALAAMKSIFNRNAYPYRNVSAKDKTYSSATVFETGKSDLERLYALCTDADDRLDVDGHGTVTVTGYQAPSARAASFEVRFDERGMSEGAVTRSSDYLEQPTECHVVYTYNETVDGESVQREVHGSAINSGRTGLASRGYVVSDLQTVNDLSPATAKRARELARQRLKRLNVEAVEWKLTCAYLPIHEGDVGNLVGLTDVDGYAGTRKVLVKSLDLDLGTMTLSLTLKSANSNDTEDDE